jgi:hypothetical protein
LLRFFEINTIIPAKSRLAVIKILSQIVLADLISPSLNQRFLKQRQAEDIATAKGKGVELGRPKAQKPPETVVLERTSGWNCEATRVQSRGRSPAC